MLALVALGVERRERVGVGEAGKGVQLERIRAGAEDGGQILQQTVEPGRLLGLGREEVEEEEGAIRIRDRVLGRRVSGSVGLRAQRRTNCSSSLACSNAVRQQPRLINELVRRSSALNIARLSMRRKSSSAVPLTSEKVGTHARSIA